MSEQNRPVGPAGTDAPQPTTPPVVVKKYANRRLYNTESSSYITLENLAQMIRSGRDFVVYDAKTGEDITRGVLTQIIVEEESKGRALLPTGFLRQLICFYDDSLQALVPRYLEQAMEAFARQQEQMRRTMQQSVGNLFPFNMEEVGRQQLAMLDRAFSFFAPFYRRPPAGAEPARAGVDKAATDQELAALRAEVAALRSRLAEAEKRDPGRSVASGPGTSAEAIGDRQREFTPTKA